MASSKYLAHNSTHGVRLILDSMLSMSIFLVSFFLIFHLTRLSFDWMNIVSSLEWIRISYSASVIWPPILQFAS